MNWFPIFITILLASTTTLLAEEPNPELFQWPSFTNHHHDPISLIKRVQCGASIHNVYSCLRLSFHKAPTILHNLLPTAADCCTTMTDFRNRCSDFRIGKLESVIFPAMLFKQCSAAGDTPAPALAPDVAAGPAADVEV